MLARCTAIVSGIHQRCFRVPRESQTHVQLTRIAAARAVVPVAVRVVVAAAAGVVVAEDDNVRS